MTKSRREELPINITNELYNSDAKPTSQIIRDHQNSTTAGVNKTSYLRWHPIVLHREVEDKKRLPHANKH